MIPEDIIKAIRNVFSEYNDLLFWADETIDRETWIDMGAVEYWLASQPAQWTPVEDGTIHLESDALIHIRLDSMEVYGMGIGQNALVMLPPDLRLCRRSPVLE